MDLGYNVLIVDDVVDNVQMAMNILREENYNLTFALSGEEALTLVDTTQFDIILLDIMMPNIDGFTVCDRIKHIPEYTDVPIIFLTAKADIDSISRAFDTGGTDYITKPFHAQELLVRVKSQLELYRARLILKANNLTLEAKVKYEKLRVHAEVDAWQKELTYILTEFIENCSTETGRHVRRVAMMAQTLAKYYPPLSDEDADIVFHAAPMHDIGKVAVSQDILNKPEKLTDEEFEIMKTHTTAAHSFLKTSKRAIIQAADIIALQHHEKWDGTGYPKGLKGDAIHPYGRIMAIIDVFDALLHERCYKKAWSVDDSVAYIAKHSGTHFDPELVYIFMENVDEFISIATS